MHREVDYHLVVPQGPRGETVAPCQRLKNCNRTISLKEAFEEVQMPICCQLDRPLKSPFLCAFGNAFSP